jgi:hypothetical protein
MMNVAVSREWTPVRIKEFNMNCAIRTQTMDYI